MRSAASLAIFTLGIAKTRKAALSKLDKTRFIKKMNRCYLAISILIALAIALGSQDSIASVQSNASAGFNVEGLRLVARAGLGWYLLSRCTEVAYSFLKDAGDKLRVEKASASALRWHERVRLALNSYCELILNFGLLYGLLPASVWSDDPKIERVAGAIWYSANVITTSGGGGFVPAGSAWQGAILQALTVYEVGCGLILIVVCFTIYVGHGLAEFEGEGFDNAGRDRRLGLRRLNENRDCGPGSSPL